MNIHDHIKNQTGYAQFLVEEGDCKKAAKVLRKLAGELETHQERCLATIEMQL